MRFWVDVAHLENEFVEVARMAGHRRAHDKATADFFVMESTNLVAELDGRLVNGHPPGDAVGGPSPRFEFQVLPVPAHRDGIGDFTAVTQIVDNRGRVSSFGFGRNLDLHEDAFVEFLLHVGEGSGVDDAVELEVVRIPDAVEEFLTLWAMTVDSIELDAATRRIAEALVAMVGEVVKAEDPPRDVLRSAFNWFAAKLDKFADQFAGSAGTAFGTSFGAAAGVGVGAAMTRRLPQLVEAIGKVLRLLG